MPLDLREELDALTRDLDTAGIPCAVCGALALAIHGHPRATRDIDLMTDGQHIDALKAVARVHGFVLEALPMYFRESGVTLHRLSHIVGTHEVAQLSDLSFRQPLRVSMEPADIEARLRECAEMSAVCLELAQLAQPNEEH